MNALAEVAKVGVVLGVAGALWWSRRFKTFWWWVGRPVGSDKKEEQ